jgi:hypothetical protein
MLKMAPCQYEWDDATFTGLTWTVNYAAPAMYQEEGPTSKVDMFSFGLILYAILVGLPVFPPSMHTLKIMNQVLKGDMPPVPDKCGAFMQSLIRRCWSMTPQCRPSFDDIFHELQSNGFAIFPGADPGVIREYVLGIIAWETGYLLSKQDRQTCHE